MNDSIDPRVPDPPHWLSKKSDFDPLKWREYWLTIWHDEQENKMQEWRNQRMR